MDSYMVRIYRKEENNPQRLVGVVQKVGGGEKEVFSTLDELWSILNLVKKELANQKKNRAPKPGPNGNGLGFRHRAAEHASGNGLQTIDFRRKAKPNSKELHQRQKPRRFKNTR